MIPDFNDGFKEALTAMYGEDSKVTEFSWGMLASGLSFLLLLSIDKLLVSHGIEGEGHDLHSHDHVSMAFNALRVAKEQPKAVAVSAKALEVAQAEAGTGGSAEEGTAALAVYIALPDAGGPLPAAPASTALTFSSSSSSSNVGAGAAAHGQSGRSGIPFRAAGAGAGATAAKQGTTLAVPALSISAFSDEEGSSEAALGAISQSPSSCHAHGHGHSHGHNHGSSSSSSSSADGSAGVLHAGKKKGLAQAWIFILALSLHAVFDGLSLGAEQNKETFYGILAAVVGHKLFDGLAAGAAVFSSALPFRHALVLVVFCALMTPLGIIIGMVSTDAVASTQVLLASSIIVAISSGSFLFISLTELMPASLADGRLMVPKLLAFFLGYAAMIILAAFV